MSKKFDFNKAPKYVAHLTVFLAFATLVACGTKKDDAVDVVKNGSPVNPVAAQTHSAGSSSSASAASAGSLSSAGSVSSAAAVSSGASSSVASVAADASSSSSSSSAASAAANNAAPVVTPSAAGTTVVPPVVAAAQNPAPVVAPVANAAPTPAPVVVPVVVPVAKDAAPKADAKDASAAKDDKSAQDDKAAKEAKAAKESPKDPSAHYSVEMSIKNTDVVIRVHELDKAAPDVDLLGKITDPTKETKLASADGSAKGTLICKDGAKMACSKAAVKIDLGHGENISAVVHQEIFKMSKSMDNKSPDAAKYQALLGMVADKKAELNAADLKMIRVDNTEIIGGDAHVRVLFTHTDGKTVTMFGVFKATTNVANLQPDKNLAATVAKAKISKKAADGSYKLSMTPVGAGKDQTLNLTMHRSADSGEE